MAWWMNQSGVPVYALFISIDSIKSNEQKG